MKPEIIERKWRISAVYDGSEICGAYSPEGHKYWQLYVTKSVFNLTGLRTPPHRENFWGDHGRIDSRAWVELIASLYCLAVQQQEAMSA